MQGVELELASWRKYLVNGGVQTQCDYLLQLMKEMEQNDGKAKGVSEKELDAVIDWCAEDLKVFPWGKYTETKELTKDDPLNSASMKLYFLLFTNELNLPRAIAFADYVEKGSGVSEELRKNWFRQSSGCLRVVSAAKVWDKRFKNKGGVSKDEFVKVVLDKTYMGRGYPYFGSFLHEKDNRKERIAELRNDKETLAKVIQSLTEDFPEGNKLPKPVDPMQLRRFPRSLQMHILDAVKSLLTLEEQYYWFKENVGKPGILENYKEEMEQFIAWYAVELETQRRRPTVEKFVKVVLDKTYMSQRDHVIFGYFLLDKGLVSELQGDRPALAKVMESLSVDFHSGYKSLQGIYIAQEGNEFFKENQLQHNVMKAAKTLLTREELYSWFKENVDKPGILRHHYEEMKQFIADYEGK
ncbi:MAG: hypothetical protein K6G44_08060 [Lentisphaeria bacterium]|nr:hypothetical protein [Lentisphaeria bacterium]